MSGGGRTVRRGGMGRSAVATRSPGEIKKLESDQVAMENRLRQLQERENELEHHLKTLEPEMLQMKRTYDTCSSELTVRFVPLPFIFFYIVLLFFRHGKKTSRSSCVN